MVSYIDLIVILKYLNQSNFECVLTCVDHDQWFELLKYKNFNLAKLANYITIAHFMSTWYIGKRLSKHSTYGHIRERERNKSKIGIHWLS